MKRSRIIKAAAFSAVFLANIASAGIPEAYAGNPILEALNQQLIAEGFEIVSIKTTFLRRYKIEAHAPGIDREIVLAPGTGAILRDEQEIVALETMEPDEAPEADTSSPEADNTGLEPDNGDGEEINSESSDTGSDTESNNSEGEETDHESSSD